ncbi:MAG: AraC family transcriptional regulator [Nocardioides sp.]|nr:AraC family transcriptional regulator [Nocardioides sp.]
MAGYPARRPRIRAWRPDVPGVAEVLHAHFPEHVYPLHTHDTWTLLVVDDGLVRYDLDRQEHGALRSLVTLLPPHVPHDGRSVNDTGFRKRVVYLDEGAFDATRIGNAVDHPGWADSALRDQIHLLHRALASPGDAFEAEGRLALVRERLSGHLAHDEPPGVRHGRTLAHRLRDLLDAHLVIGLTLADAASALGATETHLIRCFTSEFGIPPHQYLTGRRLDRARRLLLAGRTAADTAHEVGFYDQAHLTRHFKRLLGITPGAYAGAA